MPDTQVERISQLDIGDGKLYEFAGANSGVVFNNVTEALAAIQAGTVQNGDVFYIKNDGTSGYPVFIGTSAQITTADNAGKIPAGMLIFCTDDSVNDITALQVSYGDTTVKAKLDELGDADISDIGDGTVTGAVSQLNSDLTGLLRRAGVGAAGVAVSAGTVSDYRIPATNIDGYSVVGVVGVTIAAGGGCTLVSYEFEYVGESLNVFVRIRNNGTSSITPSGIYVTLLYCKTDFLYS